MRLIKSSLLLIVVLLSFTVTSQVVIDTFYTRVSSGGSDAMIASGVLKNKNFKNKKTVNVFQKNPENNSVVFRSLLDFDLTQIPTDAIIVEAKLYLTPKTVNNNHNHPIYIERINESWDRNTIKWNNQPRVNHSDKLFSPHSVTETNTTHEFDIKRHIQKMVSFPTSNFGMRLRLKNEFIAVPTGFGVRYHAANSISNSNHPRLAVSYVMPIEITATVQHCTVGNNDGSITATITGGSTSYTQFKWFKYDMGQVSLLTTGTDFTTLPLTNITNGLYLLQVKDNFNTIGYQYVLVGKEGVTTTVQFHNNNPNNTQSKKYNEDAIVKYKYQVNVGNKNYKNNKYSNAEDNARNKFYTSSLLRYKVDFDGQLEFLSANLSMVSNVNGHLRQNSSVTNAGYLSRVTSSWNEKIVTWNTKPSISITDQMAIQETTPVGLVVRNDTFDLLNYIDYWQNNPLENHGIELSLQNYGAPKHTRLSYYSYDVKAVNKRPIFELSFDVKSEELFSARVDVNSLGDSIHVYPENGIPPYSYLWSNGNATNELGNITDGIYWVKITDESGEMIKYVVSKEQDVIWDNKVCISQSGNTITNDSTCDNNIYHTSTATSNSKNQNLGIGDGWVETQIIEDANTKAFGFSDISIVLDDYSTIYHGFLLLDNNDFQIIKEGVIESEVLKMKKNDILKLEKCDDIISYKINGKEINYIDLGSRQIQPVLVGAAILSEGAVFSGVRFGRLKPNFVNEPCDMVFENLNIDDLGQIIVPFCESDLINTNLPNGYFYEWLPKVGLSCYTCSNPTVIDENIVGSTYLLKVSHSYQDAQQGYVCASKKVSFIKKDDCPISCNGVATIIPSQDFYCEGDVIQINIENNGFDYFENTPSTNFICNNCIGGQYVVPSNSESLNFNFYSGKDANSELCNSQTIDIIIDPNCHESTGITLNNFGSVIWVEKPQTNGANDKTYLNVYCNYLNEKIIITENQIDVIHNGTIMNESEIRVLKDWTNNAENRVFNESTLSVNSFGTEYNIGNVYLIGGYQRINGVATTRFYNLLLQGTGKKELFVNTISNLTLSLNNLELATRNNIMFIDNQDILALSSGNTGFVSSNLEGGYLNWNMNLNNTYFFPLGSSIGGIRLKPIEIVPNLSERVNVRLVNHNPIFDNLTLKAADVASINSDYYYYINPNQVVIEPNNNSEYDISFYYHNIIDGDYQHVGHWDLDWAPTQSISNNLPWWEKASDIQLVELVVPTVFNTNYVKTQNWSGFNGEEFVISKAGFVINWDSFGETGDNSDENEGVIVYITPVGGSNSGGGIGNQYTAGTDDGTGNVVEIPEEIFTPSPVQGTYNINITSISCGVDGIIEFTVNNSGNIEPNSIYYKVNGNNYPLAEELYNLVSTNPMPGGGQLNLISIPEQNYICDNKVKINLTNGIILDEQGTINISTPLNSNLVINSITVTDNLGTIITPVSVTANTWGAPAGMTAGVYKIALDIIDSGGITTTVNGVFILKNI